MSYKTYLMDPPWWERGSGKIKRGADRHYDLMKTEDILTTLMSFDVFEKTGSAHLYLWVTNNFLKDGLWLMGMLGFDYKNIITWAKTKSGLGQYRGGQTEHMLFGTRGQAMMPKKKLAATTLLGRGLIPATGHSRKPEQQYAEIELVSPGPYLELFATRPRPGWDSWGTFNGRGKVPKLVRTDKNGQVLAL
jgi:N6-adenosine-specific RNA methylase IME4